jgi:hypothetical protein
MAPPEKKKLPAADIAEDSDLCTDRAVDCVVTPVRSRILEMEDVLFHSNSAVMMPENPAGPKPGSPASPGQLSVSGIRALALVFRSLQANPDQKVLIAAHTDREGKEPDNFKLSALRAQNVRYLLEGDRANWAKVAAAQHSIEDYQQILKYYALFVNWSFDPGPITDQWNQQTKHALKVFSDYYNYVFAFKPPGVLIDVNTLQEIEKKPTKGPKLMWEAVFDLYEHDLVNATTGKDVADAAFVGLRDLLKKSFLYARPDWPIVACGESFPISAKKHYRSQQDRRVEILFFEKNDLPKLVCPEQTATNHTVGECRLWNNLLHRPDYIDPATYFTATYHCQFTYYNRVLKKRIPVPDVFRFKAWKGGVTELTTETAYDAGRGIYILTVHGIVDSPREKDIHFTSDTKGPNPTDPCKWVYTKGDGTLEIRALTLEDYEKLSFAEQLRHYDLPGKWDSRNWPCLIAGYTRDFAEQLVMPTSLSDPLTFNLDTIALVDENEDQNILDKDESGKAPIPLDADSRISMLCVDGEDLVLGNEEDPAQTYFSKPPFERNVVMDVPDNVRLVVFANGFYDVYNKRTAQGAVFDPALRIRPLRGCRAAKLNDPDCHVVMKLKNSGSSTGEFLYFANGCGNYELHYVHKCAPLSGPGGLEILSFLLIYWSVRFRAATLTPPGKHFIHGDEHNYVNHYVSKEDVKKVSHAGLVSADLRWNGKQYVFMPLSAPVACKIKLKPWCFFEAKKKGFGGPHKCRMSITNDSEAGSMGIEDGELYYEEYWGHDSPFKDIDGNEYSTSVISHEIGHALGKNDEYVEDREHSFEQYYPGMPYSVEDESLMCGNKAPRMRHFWFFANKVNDASRDEKELKKFLYGAQFKVVHTYPDGGSTKVLNYYLEPRYRDIYAQYLANASDPVKATLEKIADAAVSAGTGTVGLALYKLGEDETAWNIKVPAGSPPAFGFDGILVIYIKVGFHFVSGSDGTWNKKTREDWMKSLWTALSVTVNNRFYFEYTKGAHDFKHIYVYFCPMCQKAPFTGRADYNLTISYRKSASVLRTSGANLTVPFDADRNWIAGYVLGSTVPYPGPAAPPISPPGKMLLAFITTWLNNKLKSSDFVLVEK